MHPSERATQRITRAWRELAGSVAGLKRGVQPATVVACSGGADSCALALALCDQQRGAKGDICEKLTLAHVVHNMRPRQEALQDRDAVKELSEKLNVRFVEREVRVGAGNAEANARQLRYAALAEIAREVDARFVATGHHADDQLETMLMRLMRGAGPRGLRGVLPRRALGDDVMLIRPMLGVTREDAHAICAHHNWRWQEDVTNADSTRLRAALRERVLPVLEELAPGASVRAAKSALLCAQSEQLISRRTQRVLKLAERVELPPVPFGEEGKALAGKLPVVPENTSRGFYWLRDALQRELPVVVSGALRAAALRLTVGQGADAIGSKQLDQATTFIKGDSTDPKVFEWAKNVCVRVTARGVVVKLDGIGK